MVEAIVQCTESAKSAEPGTVRSPEFWSRRGHNYLERYAYLLLFAGYVLSTVADGHLHPSLNFSAWMRRHWAFKRTIRELALH